MAYSDEVLALGPALYWAVDLEQQTVTDLTANGLDGTLTGTGVGGWLPANGDIDCLGGGLAAASPAIDSYLPSGDFSVAIVAHPEDRYTGYCLFEISDPAGSEWFAFYPGGRANNANWLVRYQGNQPGENDEAFTTTERVTLYIVTVDMTNGTVSTYDNGTLVSVISLTGSAIPAGAVLTAGLHSKVSGTYDLPYEYALGEVALFDGVLTGAQAASLAAALVVDNDRTLAHEAIVQSAQSAEYPAGHYSTIGTQDVPYGVRSLSREEMYHDASGTITGTVTDESGSPIIRRVRAYNRREGFMEKQTWSDASGGYTFTGLVVGRYYTIIAYDDTGEFNAVVADWALPEGSA